MRIVTDLSRQVLLWVAALVALPAGAAEVTGTITAGASGAEILPDGVISAPLAQVKVHIGVLEQIGQIDGVYGYLASTQTDDDGNYTFQFPDPPPEVPTSTIAHAVVVVLESQDGAVAVYDNENDPTAVACLGTNAIPIPSRGNTRIDIDVAAQTDNDSEYQARSLDFRPTEDKEAMPVFGMARCAEDQLGTSVFPEPYYDQRGLTNTKPDRFAHLAIHYARAFDAYSFVRDGLGKGAFTPVRVNAWDSFPDFAYQCSTHSILMAPKLSVFFSPDQKSAVFDMRHEYGHHFMCASPIAGSDAMPPLAPGDDSHEGIANSNSADSWTEGFASWFAAAAAAYRGENRPHVQRTAAGELDMLYGGAQLDDPFTAGEQPSYGALGEEFAVASLLWQVSDVTGSTLLSDALEGDSADLDDFNQVYAALGTDLSVAGFFDTLPCSFPATGSFVFGIDCLFIDTGFYHDLDGDGYYGPDEVAGGDEVVGSTRWPLAVRGPTIFRPHTPELEGSRLRLTVEDGAGDPVPIEAFRVEIEYDAPLEQAGSEYFESVLGDEPYEFPILVPGKPSRARITPVIAGPETAAPLIIESAFFHDRVNPFREGGVSPILAEHTFVVGAPEPGAVALGAAALMSLTRLARRSRSARVDC